MKGRRRKGRRIREDLLLIDGDNGARASTKEAEEKHRSRCGLDKKWREKKKKETKRKEEEEEDET